MSELDDFARGTVTPMLRPGEAIVAVGWMAPGNRTWRDRPERYFAVGTNQRLVVIQSRQGFMHGTPKAVNEGIASYDYLSLARVGNAQSWAMSESLALETPGGTISYNVPSPSIIGAKSVEGHLDFAQAYLPWICRHGAAGSFRTPEGVYAAAGEWWQRPALTAANELYLTRIGRTTKRNRWPVWPLILAIMCMGLLPIGWALGKEDAAKVDSARRQIEFTKKVIAEGNIQFDPEQAMRDHQAALASAEKNGSRGKLLSAGGGVGVVGFLVLFVIVGRRKRARLLAAGAGA